MKTLIDFGPNLDDPSMTFQKTHKDA
jgi:hypothetical protein